MISEAQAVVGTQVHFYDNKARLVNTTISSETLTLKGEPACHVMAQKEPMQLKYLTLNTHIPVETKPAVIAPVNGSETLPALLENKNNEEVWKDIVGYEGHYRVSSFGRIMSLKRNDVKYLVPCKTKKSNSKGIYRIIWLSLDGVISHFQIHRLVAKHFIPNPENKPQVNHIDGNPENNAVINLEWVTAKENTKHAFDTGLRKIATNLVPKYGADNHGSIQVLVYDSANQETKIYDTLTDAATATGLSIASVSLYISTKRKNRQGLVFQKFDDEDLFPNIYLQPFSINDIKFVGKYADEDVEIEITPELIKEKSKELLDLNITGVLDNDGAAKVKEAINKSVKMRTFTEKQEKEYLGEVKQLNDSLKKIITDKSAPIYQECRNTQNALQKKYDDWNDQVETARKKEQDDLNEKIKTRETAMYSNGMAFNGTHFIGHGKKITRDYLMSLPDDNYDALVSELVELQEIADALPDEVPASDEQMTQAGFKVVTPSQFAGIPMYNNISVDPARTSDIKGIYEKEIPAMGIRIIITAGEITEQPGQVVLNDRINGSKHYLQVISE